MPHRTLLPRAFYSRDTLEVARELLGKRLVRVSHGGRIAGIITETEAYRGEEDLACHARAGRTPRTAVMYGPAGHAYVYFTYGKHWLLNVVTEPPGFPAAVLIRAIKPVEGLAEIAARRVGRPRTEWTNGPGKLCQALDITGAQNSLDLLAFEGDLFIETGDPIPDQHVTTGPRVGIDRVPEPWRSIPWRFRATHDR